MEFDDVIQTRRSVHQYSDADIDDETLYDIFEDVRQTPSSFNLQPWEFLVVRGDDLADLQSVAYGQEHVTDAAAAVVVLGTLDPSDHADRVTSDLLEKGYLPSEDAADARLDTVDGLADADSETRRLWTSQSSSLAAMTLMHAAWDRGIASCPMGGFDADALHETFDIGDDYEAVMLVTLGYPEDEAADIERPRKFRRSTDEIVHLDEFDPAAR
ncbi:Nitroreductase [Haloplanus vescus]|mgnify:CR=1 FL=1|uniref:Nitroreductase n=1 Tax=Haloplanus vescus TaxID=555874 RepID=A0A1H3YA74_9EURY|nr:nitroreductase family protein [Haloplanus vescus]SEA08587.1 Nitroreductase [Haloplanus vescus]